MRLFEYIEQGGPIMYVLLTLNIIGFALLFWKTFSLFDAKKNFDQTVEDLKNRFGARQRLKNTRLYVQQDLITSGGYNKNYD